MKIAKDSFWLFTARVGVQGMAALATIFLARSLGKAMFGEYAVIAAVVFVGNMLTTFGTDMSLIREIAARDDFSLASSALTIQLALSIFFILLTWLIAPLFFVENVEAIYALRLYIFALIPLSFFTVFTSVLRGKQLSSAYTLLNLIGSFVQLAVVLVFVRLNASIVVLAILLISTQFAAALIGAVICHLKIQGFWRNWHFDSRDVLVLLKVSSPLAVLTIVMMIYQKLSILMISMMSGSAMTGLFSAAQRTVEASKTGHVSVFTALYPAMAQNEESYFRQSWIFLVVGAVLGAVTLSALAMPITRILFGAEYEASVPALQILAWMLIPYTVSAFLILKFIAMDRESPVLRASLTSLVILILFSLIWIPRAGLEGASRSALVAESIQAILLFLQWRAYEFSKLSR